MQFQLIRNATLKLSYAGRTILIDPYFAPRHSLPSFTGRSPNPMTELPVPVDQILAGVELVIVSHLHTDHFDDVAKESIDKALPLICRPGDEETIRGAGFSNVTPLASETTWEGIRIVRREGNHGSGPVLAMMGEVMGFTLEAESEPSVYWTGDTIDYAPVRETVAGFAPDIIVTHSCGALWDGTLIVMDAEQTVAVARSARPEAIIIATHMEALDHASVDRAALRAYAGKHGVADQKLLIPADGDVLTLSANSR